MSFIIQHVTTGLYIVGGSAVNDTAPITLSPNLIPNDVFYEWEISPAFDTSNGVLDSITNKATSLFFYPDINDTFTDVSNNIYTPVALCNDMVSFPLPMLAAPNVNGSYTLLSQSGHILSIMSDGSADRLVLFPENVLPATNPEKWLLIEV